MSNTIPGLEAWLTTPPDTDIPDEPCDRCGRDLGSDSAMKVADPRYPGHWAYYCEDCAMPVERCDQCHFVRCACDES